MQNEKSSTNFWAFLWDVSQFWDMNRGWIIVDVGLHPSAFAFMGFGVHCNGSISYSVAFGKMS